MAHITYELTKFNLLSEMDVIDNKPMLMYCDNQAAMYIINNSIFYERTKHIEVNSHFIRDIVMTYRISSH